jgi:hypothetical protein
MGMVVTMIGLSLAINTRLAVAAGSDEARDVIKQGTIELGVVSGFWQASTVVGHAGSANRSAALVLPRLGLVVTDPLGKSWWEGNVEVLVEPVFGQFTQPFTAQMAGGAMVVKYNLLSFGRWMPFWDAGVGVLWTNLAPRIPEESTPFEFELETGPGLSYFLTKAAAVTMGVRFHHISNAGMGNRNTGINAFLPYVGLSIFLP